MAGSKIKRPQKAANKVKQHAVRHPSMMPSSLSPAPLKSEFNLWHERRLQEIKDRKCPILMPAEPTKFTKPVEKEKFGPRIGTLHKVEKKKPKKSKAELNLLEPLKRQMLKRLSYAKTSSPASGARAWRGHLPESEGTFCQCSKHLRNLKRVLKHEETESCAAPPRQKKRKKDYKCEELPVQVKPTQKIKSQPKLHRGNSIKRKATPDQLSQKEKRNFFTFPFAFFQKNEPPNLAAGSSSEKNKIVEKAEKTQKPENYQNSSSTSSCSTMMSRDPFWINAKKRLEARKQQMAKAKRQGSKSSKRRPRAGKAARKSRQF